MILNDQMQIGFLFMKLFRCYHRQIKILSKGHMELLLEHGSLVKRLKEAQTQNVLDFSNKYNNSTAEAPDHSPTLHGADSRRSSLISIDEINIKQSPNNNKTRRKKPFKLLTRHNNNTSNNINFNNNVEGVTTFDGKSLQVIKELFGLHLDDLTKAYKNPKIEAAKVKLSEQAEFLSKWHDDEENGIRELDQMLSTRKDYPFNVSEIDLYLQETLKEMNNERRKLAGIMEDSEANQLTILEALTTKNHGELGGFTDAMGRRSRRNSQINAQTSPRKEMEKEFADKETMTTEEISSSAAAHRHMIALLRES